MQRRAGFDVGEGDGEGEAVEVGEGEEVGDADTVADGMPVAVGNSVGLAVGVGVAVNVGEAVGDVAGCAGLGLVDAWIVGLITGVWPVDGWLPEAGALDVGVLDVGALEVGALEVEGTGGVCALLVWLGSSIGLAERAADLVP